MKRFKVLPIIASLMLGLVSIAIGQQTITPEESTKFIGQQKTVCGNVASAHFAAHSKREPTFLNLNKPYPNQIFTVLIWGSDTSKFEKPHETLYSGIESCVTGMIQSYQGRLEIVVKEPSQIKIR